MKSSNNLFKREEYKPMGIQDKTPECEVKTSQTNTGTYQHLRRQDISAWRYRLASVDKVSETEITQDNRNM